MLLWVRLDKVQSLQVFGGLFMATRKSSSTKRRSNTSEKSKSSTSGKGRRSQAAIEREKAENFRMEVILWIVVAVCLLLFISNFGVG